MCMTLITEKKLIASLEYETFLTVQNIIGYEMKGRVKKPLIVQQCSTLIGQSLSTEQFNINVICLQMKMKNDWKINQDIDFSLLKNSGK